MEVEIKGGRRILFTRVWHVGFLLTVRNIKRNLRTRGEPEDEPQMEAVMNNNTGPYPLACPAKRSEVPSE